MTHAPTRPADTGFVPVDLDATDWASVQPLADALLGRELENAEAFRGWLLDRSALDAACSEGAARLYINMTCNTAAGSHRSYEKFMMLMVN